MFCLFEFGPPGRVTLCFWDASSQNGNALAGTYGDSSFRAFQILEVRTVR